MQKGAQPTGEQDRLERRALGQENQVGATVKVKEVGGHLMAIKLRSASHKMKAQDALLKD